VDVSVPFELFIIDRIKFSVRTSRWRWRASRARWRVVNSVGWGNPCGLTLMGFVGMGVGSLFLTHM
jgi:hypothetical protein